MKASSSTSNSCNQASSIPV